MSDWPVVFRTYSKIEATVVCGLLEAHGIPGTQLPPGVNGAETSANGNSPGVTPVR